jgi:IS4 transposase
LSERRRLRTYLRALVSRCGPPDDATVWEHMILTTEVWWTGREASSSALVEGTKRRHGKGRRPTLQAIDRRLKRQGLGVSALDQMLRRLEELTAAEKSPPTIAELAAKRRAQA